MVVVRGLTAGLSTAFDLFSQATLPVLTKSVVASVVFPRELTNFLLRGRSQTPDSKFLIFRNLFRASRARNSPSGYQCFVAISPLLKYLTKL